MGDILKGKAQKHLSVSQVNMYTRCPLQYRFRYLEGLIIPPNFNLHIGLSVHKGIEANYNNKKDKKELLTLDAVKDAYSDYFEKNKDGIEDVKTTVGVAKDIGYGLTGVHYTDIAPTVQPVHIEKGFLIDFPKKELVDEERHTSTIIDIPYKFKGFIDVIDDQGVVIDNKTAGRSYQENAAEDDLQLIGYSLAYQQEFGKLPTGTRFDIMVKTKVPKTQQVRGTITEDKINRFLVIVANAYKGIQAGVFYPRKDVIACSWCGYKDKCAALKSW